MTRKSAERTTYRVQVLERTVDILQVLSEIPPSSNKASTLPSRPSCSFRR